MQQYVAQAYQASGTGASFDYMAALKNIFAISAVQQQDMVQSITQLSNQAAAGTLTAAELQAALTQLTSVG